MKKLLGLLLLTTSMASFAQYIPIHTAPIDPLMTEDALARDPLYNNLKSMVEATYDVKCQEPDLQIMTRGILAGNIDRFKIECPKDSKSGVNIIVKVKSKKSKIYVGALSVRPYGKMLK